jgi:hypothetical protein
MNMKNVRYDSSNHAFLTEQIPTGPYCVVLDYESL